MLEMQRPVRDRVGLAPDQEVPVSSADNGLSAAPRRGDRIRRLLPRGRGGGGGAKPVRADGEDRGSYDLRNAWQVVAGSILIPLGVVFILLGWYGSAHARVVQQQIPYLVSGAFIGLGCMVVGGLLYWGHWLYRLYDQKELHHEEELQVLHDLVKTLTSQGAGGGAHSAATSDAPADSSQGSFLATATGTVYHRAGCAVIAHHPEDVRVVGAANLGGLQPCQICVPGS
ncbi:MAG TPA: hypothetical protein VG412_06740 [Acidimicrobiales bacterium]|jgi:hypothetical protein|nr:hypothetical protein [Acidimicrobiales bacterium]